MTGDPTAAGAHLERVRAAHRAVADARAAEEQAIRDAAAAGASVSSIARDALGTADRTRVYALLAKGADGGDPRPPARTPVVYLRGARMRDDTWRRVERAMWARGWATERDRLTAWHAARGGSPVVLCDFSADLHRTSPAVGGGLNVVDPYVVVGRVRARYDEGADEAHDLALVNGGSVAEPHPTPFGTELDEQALARLVAAALA